MSGRVVLSYTSEKGREHLSDRSRYHFKIDNNSIAENYLLNPFWNWFTASCIPTWVAPNLVTFSGFIFMVVMYLILWAAYPATPIQFLRLDATAESFRYIWLFSAICMFIYQTLDGCDGKQARRTESSSPLGEAFDHGADALSMTIMSYALTLVLEKTADKCSHVDLLHISTWSAFISSHWEHRYTDVFFMGYLSSGDGILVIIIFFLINTFTLGSVWKIAVFTIPEALRELATSLGFNQTAVTVGDFAFYIILICAATSTLRCCFVVAAAVSKDHRSFISAVLDWVPVVIMLASYVVYSRLDAQFYVENYMLITTVFGLIFGIYSTTIDVMRVTAQTIPWIAPQFVLSLGSAYVGIYNHLYPFMDKYTLLFALFVWNLVHYLYYVISIANTFCSCLKIEAFRIKPKVK